MFGYTCEYKMINQYVYAVTTPDRKGLVKIGKHTGSERKLMGRYLTYFSTANIEQFVQSNDYGKLEKAIHKYLSKYKVDKREWFDCSLDIIEEAFDKCCSMNHSIIEATGSLINDIQKSYIDSLREDCYDIDTFIEQFIEYVYEEHGTLSTLKESSIVNCITQEFKLNESVIVKFMAGTCAYLIDDKVYICRDMKSVTIDELRETMIEFIEESGINCISLFLMKDLFADYLKCHYDIPYIIAYLIEYTKDHWTVHDNFKNLFIVNSYQSKNGRVYYMTPCITDTVSSTDDNEVIVISDDEEINYPELIEDYVNQFNWSNKVTIPEFYTSFLDYCTKLSIEPCSKAKFDKMKYKYVSKTSKGGYLNKIY